MKNMISHSNELASADFQFILHSLDYRRDKRVQTCIKNTQPKSTNQIIINNVITIFII